MSLADQIERLLVDNSELRRRLRSEQTGGGGGGAAPPSGPSGPDMEARVRRLEQDVGEVRAVLVRLEPLIVRIDEQVRTTLPHLATKAELADKPGKAYLWAILAALLAAYGAGLAALAILK